MRPTQRAKNEPKLLGLSGLLEWRVDGKRRTDDDWMIFCWRVETSMRLTNPSTSDCRRSICLEGSRMRFRSHGILLRTTMLTADGWVSDRARAYRRRWPERQSPCFRSKSMRGICLEKAAAHQSSYPVRASARSRLGIPSGFPAHTPPAGPLDTIGGLRLETPDGKAIPWRRDEVELYRVTCEVPSGVREIVARLDTICNAPAAEASGHLSYGNASVGIINLPTCLLYPEGPTAQETRVELALRLPEKWQFATALKSERSQEWADHVSRRVFEYAGRFPLDRRRASANDSP